MLATALQRFSSAQRSLTTLWQVPISCSFDFEILSSFFDLTVPGFTHSGKANACKAAVIGILLWQGLAAQMQTLSPHCTELCLMCMWRATCKNYSCLRQQHFDSGHKNKKRKYISQSFGWAARSWLGWLPTLTCSFISSASRYSQHDHSKAKSTASVFLPCVSDYHIPADISRCLRSMTITTPSR